MRKIVLLLTASISLIAGDPPLEDAAVLIDEVKAEMKPIFQNISGYAADPQKGMLIELVTGMPPHRIVYENKQELRELSDMFIQGKIDITDFCDGTFDLCVKLPTIIADEEKYTIFFAGPDGEREAVIAFYDEL